ncbi:MAG TPA: PBP1A family penicillin-binding protein [Pyrinomonadaceae bacterium]|jgi:penicillin-binding protein 1B|nr:PBP1A family penicillin-binding protein [Pyrinomonadaceae bacterium]
MAVRHPPQRNAPPAPQRRRAPRSVRYVEPEAGFFRRWGRRVFSPPVLIVVAMLTTFTVGVLGYYYHVFSQRVDKLISGEIYTRSAGIYTAPRQLRVGANLSVDDLVTRLKRADYVEKSQQADEARSRYAVAGTTVEITPGQSAVVDDRRVFPHLRVAFAKTGKGVTAITDADTNGKLQTALLEPEQVSFVAGAQRERRRIIGFNDAPKSLVDAVTVTEDRTFFQHYGINLRGILRAFVRRYELDSTSPLARQGGSSITQQLVKNLLLSPEYSLRRKFAEAYMSVILETRLGKQEIFALYCNQVYLGQHAGFSINGFGEASRVYFNKDVTALTLPESAFLAGIIRSPNRYNPYHNIGTATSRRNQVLDSMADEGVITRRQADEAKAAELKIAPARGRVDTSEAPYFVDYVQGQLADILADARAAEHLRIYTTIDMELQRAAYAAVTKQLAALDKIYAKKYPPGTLQAALVAMNADTGEVVAMVGGRDYEKSQLNRATDALRQPGSVFKPFVYATALNTAYDPVPRVITAATTYLDEPKTFTFDNQEYSPGNFADAYAHAPVTLRDALVHSKNVITVELAMEVTMGRVMNLAARAGLPKPPRTYPAMALGTSEATPLQVASAYTTFARLGTRTTPVGISRVTTGRGATIAAPNAQANDVMRPEIAYIMNSFMKDVVNRGTAASLRGRGFRFNVAGKTGTSRDGWFAGFTPHLVCAVWVGFDDNSQLGLTGAQSALPIFSDFMQAALTSHPEWQGDWQPPAGLEEAQIDPRTGLLAAADSLVKRTELFVSGTAPTQQSDEPPDDSVIDETIPGESDEPTYAPAPPPPPGATEIPPYPDATPTPRNRNAPRLEGRGVAQPDGTTRLMGTITLDIDPTTGLIAAPTCPVIRSRTFQIGTEPRRYCGPEYHNGRTIAPTATRPRLVNPSNNNRRE